MMINGKVVKAKDSIPFKENKQMSSIINYLVEAHGYKSLQPYFTQNLDSLLKEKLNDDGSYVYDHEKTQRIHNLINMPYIGDWEMSSEQQANRLRNYYTKGTYGIMNADQYNYLIINFDIDGYSEIDDNKCTEYIFGKEKIKVCFDRFNSEILITQANIVKEALVINMTALLDSLNQQPLTSYHFEHDELSLIDSNNILKARIIFEHIFFENVNDEIKQLGFNASILLKSR